MPHGILAAAAAGRLVAPDDEPPRRPLRRFRQARRADQRIRGHAARVDGDPRQGAVSAGVDGSLSDRFKSTDAQGRVWAKTGSLGGVKTLSGYATTNRGERIAFSILSNNFNMPTKRITDAIDSIVDAILNDAARK